MNRPQEISLERACQILQVARSTTYLNQQKPAEPAALEAIRNLLEKFPSYGYRRVAAQLSLSQKRARTFMRKANLNYKRPKKKRSTLPSHFAGGENLVQRTRPTGPGKHLACDVTAIAAENRKFLYFAIVLDTFTREIVGWAISNRNDTKLTKEALEMAWLNSNLAQNWIHHSDRGANYTSHDYLKLIQKLGGKPSFSDPGKPTQNAYAESFFKTFKLEEGGLDTYSDIDDATNAIEKYLQLYHNERLHSALGMTTPRLFKEEYNSI